MTLYMIIEPVHLLPEVFSVIVIIIVYLKCDDSQWPVFLPAASTPLGSSVVGHRIDNDTDPCLRLEPCGLLL